MNPCPPSTRTILGAILALTLTFCASGALLAQPPEAEPPPPETDLETDTVESPPGDLNDYEVRNQLGRLLRNHPRGLATTLVLAPALLSNEEFLAAYPALERFLAEHPEVRRQPYFYLAEFQGYQGSSPFGEVLEGLIIFAVFALIAVALGWLIRTVIEQKRWNRLSRTQSDVHNKILDRFGTSEELLDYVRTPAGARFLESAPIPLHAERRTESSAPGRVLWSVQIGVVVSAAALGMLLISGQVDEDSADALFALGAICLSVGVGFVGSAAVSLFLSRRLGLWEPPQGGDEVSPRQDDVR